MSLVDNGIDQLSNSKSELGEILKFCRVGVGGDGGWGGWMGVVVWWPGFEMTNCQLLSLPKSQTSTSFLSATQCFSLLTKSLFDVTDDRWLLQHKAKDEVFIKKLGRFFVLQRLIQHKNPKTSISVKSWETLIWGECYSEEMKIFFEFPRTWTAK